MTPVWPSASRTRAPAGARVVLAPSHGYSMVELMVVVVILGILLTIGIPALLGARVRSQDRAAQSNISNVYTVEKIVFSGNSTYTDDPVVLRAQEPSQSYVTADTPLVKGPIYVLVEPGNIVYVMAKSASGTCFYMRDPDGAGPIYATSPNCGKGPLQTYGPSW
jgi:prepilin-type N-terminal cleavage/methylation domain-containing protein